VAPAAPLATPVKRAANPALKVESSDDLVLSPRARRSRGGGWVKLVIGLAVFLVLAGGLAGGVYLLVRSLSGKDDNDPVATKAAGNFTLTIPRGWRQDQDLKSTMHVQVALTRGKPRSHAALLFKDCKTRAASDAELLDGALAALRRYFASVDYEDPFQGNQRGRTGTLGGEPAIVMKFQGTDRNEVEMLGYVHMLTRQGYAYWLFTWGPSDNEEQLAAGWEAVRAGFRLFNQREGWKPRPPETVPFARDDLGVRLDYLKGLWHKEDNPKEHDDRAALVLRGFEPTEDEETGRKVVVAHAGKAATIWVLVLKEEKDARSAFDAALEHVRKKQLDTYPALKIEPVVDRKSGKPTGGVEVGALRGQWGKLQVTLDADAQRYDLLAVVNVAGKGVLAIRCECLWERRDYWDQEFKALIETVRPAGKR
jgi:hypothetical protein